MKTQKIMCESCGAPLAIHENSATVTCAACGTAYGIDWENGEASIKVAEQIAFAIKESSHITQRELQRIQYENMINLDELKLNSIQGEMRSLRRHNPPDVNINTELAYLELDACEIRLHIRGIRQKIAMLERDWHESLDTLRSNMESLDAVIAPLSPYSYVPVVLERVNELREERKRIETKFDQMDVKEIQQLAVSTTYPRFEMLTIPQMEELRVKIPADLTLLKERPDTKMRRQYLSELSRTQEQITAHYPRKKMESLIGKIYGLDIIEPYPEAPAELAPMVDTLAMDLQRVNQVPAADYQVTVSRELSQKLAILQARMLEDIPAARKKARKKKRLITCGVIFVVLFAILGFIVGCSLVVTHLANDNEQDGSVGSIFSSDEDNLQGDVQEDNNNTDFTIGNGEYIPVTKTMVQVSVAKAYLREKPEYDSQEVYSLEKNDVLLVQDVDTVQTGWHLVVTSDGMHEGYLADEWISGIEVRSLPGDDLQLNGSGSEFFAMDFSDPLNGLWGENTIDEGGISGTTTYVNEQYRVNLNAVKSDVFYYYYIRMDEMPDDWGFSIQTDVKDISRTTSYGVIVNYVEDTCFDVGVIDRDGEFTLMGLRNGEWVKFYTVALNDGIDYQFDANGENLIEVSHVRNASSDDKFIYGVNGKAIVEITYQAQDPGLPLTGVIFVFTGPGGEIDIVLDDFSLREN